MDEQNINTTNQPAVNPLPQQPAPPLPQNTGMADNPQIDRAKEVENRMNSIRKEVEEMQNKEAVPDVPKSYTAKPTELPNFDYVKETPAVKQDDEIVLPSAPSPLPESMLSENLATPVKDSLEDIVPDIGIPKAVAGTAKENNLASPEGILGKINEEKTLIPEDKQMDNFAVPDKTEIGQTTDADLGSMDGLLKQAIDKNASDLHITVGYPVTIRIDGELEALDEKIISPAEAESLIYSILSDEKKELLEVNKEIDFAYSFTGGENARFRVNAYYSKGNLSAAFRLIPSHIRSVEELMLPQIYHQFAQLKQGLVLVTGPTGHGKSTTIAAILEDVNRTRFCHIVTIEDPIEYVFQGKKALIDQREMNSDTHSWTVALKSALRQDPDVILVGEMRDYETIASAITLAETGHLVFATLHTNSAAQTIDRIIDVFPENQQAQVKTQLANILEAVVAQRLIPLDTGGRRAVSEIMLGIPSIKNLIREGKTHQIDNVIRTSTDVGMVSLESSLVKLVREGVISIEKAQEYAVYPEEVVRFMKK